MTKYVINFIAMIKQVFTHLFINPKNIEKLTIYNNYIKIFNTIVYKKKRLLFASLKITASNIK